MWAVLRNGEWVGVVYGDSHRSAFERAVQLFGGDVTIKEVVSSSAEKE